MAVDVDPLAREGFEGFKEMSQELQNESSRGKAIIGAAFLDDLLRRAIDARLVDHKASRKLADGFNAPLGTFSARIAAALAIGIINVDEFADLEIVRAVRNEFAHELACQFSSPKIADKCRKLKIGIPDTSFHPGLRFLAAVVALSATIADRMDKLPPHRLSAVFGTGRSSVDS